MYTHPWELNAGTFREPFFILTPEGLESSIFAGLESDSLCILVYHRVSCCQETSHPLHGKFVLTWKPSQNQYLKAGLIGIY